MLSQCGSTSERGQASLSERRARWVDGWMDTCRLTPPPNENAPTELHALPNPRTAACQHRTCTKQTHLEYFGGYTHKRRRWSGQSLISAKDCNQWSSTDSSSPSNEAPRPISTAVSPTSNRLKSTGGPDEDNVSSLLDSNRGVQRRWIRFIAFLLDSSLPRAHPNRQRHTTLLQNSMFLHSIAARLRYSLPC